MPSLTHRSTLFPDYGSSFPFTDLGVSSPREGAREVDHPRSGNVHNLYDMSIFGQYQNAPSRRRPSNCTDHHGSKEDFECFYYSSPESFLDQHPHQTQMCGPSCNDDMQSLSLPIPTLNFGISPSENLGLQSYNSQYMDQIPSSSSSPTSALLLTACDSLSASPTQHNLSPSHPLTWPPASQNNFSNLEAHSYSPHFPRGHMLNTCFTQLYELGAQLGSGGYGFVLTAQNRVDGNEVAVKFIVKALVPEDAWMEHEEVGWLPTEVMLLGVIEHENIIKCLDVFEDNLYFYLVQELHGTPWHKPAKKLMHHLSVTENTTRSASLPYLSPCVSEHSSVDHGPYTPPQQCAQLDIVCDDLGVQFQTDHEPYSISHPKLFEPESQYHSASLSPCLPEISRPSHDLFECIEQSPHKRLTEDQARYIFAQVVEAVYYLDSHGISHRDIKDENLVIDKDLKVKLIDFGSAVVVDPEQSRPYYRSFYGTAAYASSEILRKKIYQAPPAEIWTLGVLLSFLLTGTTCFLSPQDAISGKIVLNGATGATLSRDVLSLMCRCLEPDPRKRANINEVRAHKWLRGAL